MNLNYNSISARLYRWFYNLDFYDKMPKNLCPYFWKLVFMWLAVGPYVLLTLPAQLYNKFKQQSIKDTFSDMGVILLISVVATCLVTSIVYLFGVISDDNPWSCVAAVGGIFWAFILIIIGAILFMYFKEKIVLSLKEQSKGYIPTPKKPNIIGEFIKAKYHKYCPKITWENEANNN